MASTTEVERLNGEYKGILAATKDEPSLAISAADSLRKALLIAAASYFEYKICESVAEYVSEASAGNGLVVGIVKNKAISRQYHTWFDWNSSNANQFFGLFGADFAQMMTIRVKETTPLRESIAAFLELGRERNKLIHGDFATFPLDKTLEEIFELYTRSLPFVDGLDGWFRECVAAQRT